MLLLGIDQQGGNADPVGVLARIEYGDTLRMGRTVESGWRVALRHRGDEAPSAIGFLLVDAVELVRISLGPIVGHRSDLRDHAGDATIVRRAVDHVPAAETRTPNPDAVLVHHRLAVDIRDCRVDILLLVNRINHFANRLGLDGHAAVLVGLGHFAANHQPAVAVAPATVVVVDHHIARRSETWRDSGSHQESLRTAPSVAHHDGRKLLALFAVLGIQQDPRQPCSVTPQGDVALEDGGKTFDGLLFLRHRGLGHQRAGQNHQNRERYGKSCPSRSSQYFHFSSPVIKARAASTSPVGAWRRSANHLLDRSCHR